MSVDPQFLDQAKASLEARKARIAEKRKQLIDKRKSIQDGPLVTPSRDSSPAHSRQSSLEIIDGGASGADDRKRIEEKKRQLREKLDAVRQKKQDLEDRESKAKAALDAVHEGKSVNLADLPLSPSHREGKGESKYHISDDGKDEKKAMLDQLAEKKRQLQSELTSKRESIAALQAEQAQKQNANATLPEEDQKFFSTFHSMEGDIKGLDKYFERLASKDSAVWFSLLYHHVMPYFQLHPNMQKCFLQADNWKKWILPLIPRDEFVIQQQITRDNATKGTSMLSIFDMVIVIVSFIHQFQFTHGAEKDDVEGEMFRILTSTLQTFEDHTTAWVNRRVLVSLIRFLERRTSMPGVRGQLKMHEVGNFLEALDVIYRFVFFPPMERTGLKRSHLHADENGDLLDGERLILPLVPLLTKIKDQLAEKDSEDMSKEEKLQKRRHVVLVKAELLFMLAAKQFFSDIKRIVLDAESMKEYARLLKSVLAKHKKYKLANVDDTTFLSQAQNQRRRSSASVVGAAAASPDERLTRSASSGELLSPRRRASSTGEGLARSASSGLLVL